MAEPTIPSENLLVAGRGESDRDGLHLATRREGVWHVRQLDRVVQLAALCAHPRLPVVYGLSGMGPGRLLAWDVGGVVEGGPAVRRADLDGLGDIPCDLAVDREGRTLIAANYGFEGSGGSLTLWALDEQGTPVGPGTAVPLVGSSVDPDRQGVAHPHQVVLHDGVLHVPDLGAECVRRFWLEPEFRELEPVATPPGTGPRHMVILANPGGMPLRPVVGVVIILNTISGFMQFDVIWAMTQGGPGNATTVMSIFLYQQLFVDTNLALASATSVVLGLLALVLGFLFVRLMYRDTGATERVG